MTGRAASFPRVVRPALAAGLLGLSLAGWSAVPVEDAATVKDRSQQSYPGQDDTGSQPAPGAAGTGRLSDLFYQLEVLQQEVQDLRGIVEEQGHRLDRLAKDQQEQYLDLDRRMQALRGGSTGGGSTGGFGSPSDSSGGPGTASSADAPGGTSVPSTTSTSGSERDAYAAAFQLMKQRQFDGAVDAFNQLVVDYPNGAYTPNAFYWLGEVYLAQDEYEKARQSFAQVVNLYPDHQKVPDALYKLGVVYHRLGDLERTRQYLNRVIKEYPQSSAAGLAQTYLAEL